MIPLNLPVFAVAKNLILSEPTLLSGVLGPLVEQFLQDSITAGSEGAAVPPLDGEVHILDLGDGNLLEYGYSALFNYYNRNPEPELP